MYAYVDSVIDYGGETSECMESLLSMGTLTIQPSYKDGIYTAMGGGPSPLYAK